MLFICFCFAGRKILPFEDDRQHPATQTSSPERTALLSQPSPHSHDLDTRAHLLPLAGFYFLVSSEDFRTICIWSLERGCHLSAGLDPMKTTTLGLWDMCLDYWVMLQMYELERLPFPLLWAGHEKT